MMDEARYFFGYMDGSSPELPIGTVVTGADGSFRMDVPDLAADPFLCIYSQQWATTWEPRALHVAFTRDPRWVFPWAGFGGNETKPLVRTKPVNRSMRVELGRPFQSWSQVTWVVRPEWMPIVARYDSPVIIRVLQKARLSGRIGEKFRSENGIRGAVFNSETPPDAEYTISLNAEEAKPRQKGDAYLIGGGHNCMLKQDWSFDVRLAPGKYDLVLTEWRRGSFRSTAMKERPAMPRRIVVRRGLEVKEDKEVTVAVE
jgi:hypothetical protein